MADIEKVISSIKKCNNNVPGRCDKCPYRGKDTHDCVGELLHDALELLKERKPRKVKNIRKVTNICKCGECPSCGERLYTTANPNFCGHCGDRIDWEDGEHE